ncbi:MAG: TolC family protein [Candidatus Omnitrophica bacterium]|nr:TolC family protein [Candidatus Omnitrophota bacterium]
MFQSIRFLKLSVLILLPMLTLPIISWAGEVGVYQLSTEQRTEPSLIHLDQLIQVARERNPDMIAAKAEWLAAKKRVWIDSSLPDPMAGMDLMGGMRETRTGPEEQRFMVSQEIPFPSKLWEKGKQAQDEAKAAFERYRAAERDITNELKRSYYELYFVDASLEVIEEVKGILKKFENVAQARYSNLTGTQRDVAKAQAEVSMTLEKLFMLQQERESIAAKINALLDQDPMTEVGKATLPVKPALPQSLVELVNLAVKNRQEIKEMEALVSKAKRGKKLAWMANIPDVTVGFEYTQVGGGSTTDEMDGKDQWMFPLRINIPLWFNKNIPQIQEAQKLVEANRAKLQAAKNTTFYEVKDAYYRYDSAMKIAELYDTAVIPQAKLALTSDQAGYESGKTDFLNLLDSERVYLNAKLAHIRFLTTALVSHSDLIRATGIDLEGERHE